jgi:hypothetical protein
MIFLKKPLLCGAVAASLLCPVRLFAAPVFPVKPDATHRYLVDQNNSPFLLLGDSPQGLIVDLSTAEADAFFADRVAHGFNTVWINLLANTYTGGRANGSTYDGILPFTANVPGTGSYDLTATNESYFARVDTMVNLAAQHGLLVLLDPVETGGWLNTLTDNGTNRAYFYGQFIGARYRNFPNIVWMNGNDFYNWPSAVTDAVVIAVAQGIKDADSNHIHSVELNGFPPSGSLDDTRWNSLLGLNATYTINPTYAQLYTDYARSNHLPSFMMEANYESENAWTGNQTGRRQAYWTMTSGAAGQLFGNHYTWQFLPGWQNYLGTSGTSQFGTMAAFFQARAWHLLVPDTNHAVLTAGYGTFSSSGGVNDNDYATAARAADGSLVVVYLPSVRAISLNLSQLSGPAVGRWFDPSTGAYLQITNAPFPNTGTRSFTPPGANSDGDNDWVLVLETNPPPQSAVPALVQLNYTTPQSAQSHVTVAYRYPQSAGNANIVAIGWNDTSAVITSVTDTAGNSYQPVVPIYRTNGLSQAIYYASMIQGGSNAVTVVFNINAMFVDLRITEYSGLQATAAFDAGVSAGGNGTSGDSGAVTVTGTNDLLFAAGMAGNGFAATGNGFDERVITDPDGDMVEDGIAVLPGVYHATAALLPGTWLLQVAAFKADPPSIAPTVRIFLTATNSAVLAWPGDAAGFSLESNPNIATTNWNPVTNRVDVVGAENQIILWPLKTQQFFRLKSP